MSRRATNVLIAAAAWTAFIWGFRLWNMVGEGHSVGFLAVHGAIAAVSIAFAIALFVIAWKHRRAGDHRHVATEPVAHVAARE